jgi:vitamin B12 transport system substrate-binding protein
MSHIIRSQAKLLIAASKAATSEIGNFWEPYREVFDAKIINANPDALHRFTPRAINEMSRVCDTAYTN